MRLKVLIVFALASAAVAVLPVAASASGGVVADEYPAVLSGDQVGNLGIQVAGATLICGETSGQSMQFEAALAKPSPSVETGSVTNPDCAGGALEMKGCQLSLDPGSDSVGIGPSGCGPVNVYSSSCAGYFSIPAQDGISADYTNVGSGSEAGFNVVIDDSSVTYSVAKNNLCKGAGTYGNLDLSGEFQVSAAVDGGGATGTSVIDGDVPLGLFLAGGTPETGEARLAAPEYPVHVTGGRFNLPPFVGEVTLLEKTGLKASCTETALDGGSLSGAEYGEFSLSATYSGCTVKNMNATVSTAGCDYRFANLEDTSGQESNSYTGTAELVCDAGKAITINAGGGVCTLEIPGQSIEGDPLFMKNLFEGYESAIGMIMDGADVSYTIKGPLCGLAGIKAMSGTDGSLHSDLLLEGIYPG